MKKQLQNLAKVQLAAKSINEGLARSIVSSFVSQLDPTVSELTDIRTAVSEAVTNCIVHAYQGTGGIIDITMSYTADKLIKIVIKDKGCGIEDIKEAMQPLFTTDTTGERGGMGFTIMESFMDKLRVISRPGRGTTVTMHKQISPSEVHINKKG